MRTLLSLTLPGSRQLWFLLALAMMFVSASPVQGADANPFLGQWTSMTLEGAGPLGTDPGCQVVAWTDREIKLEPIAGNPTRVRGEWVRSYQALWMAARGEMCRFPGETKFEPGHLAVMGWTLSGSIDPGSGKMRLNGTYSQCNGNSCSFFQSSLRDFQTELTIVGGELVDADPAQKPEDHRVFISKSSEAPRMDAVLRELKPLLSTIDGGDYNRLYDQTASQMKSKVTRDQMRASMSELHTNTGPTLSRSVMQTIYASYGPNNDMHRTEFAIVINTIYFTQNRSGLEYSILHREDGKWKMGYYWIGGKISPPQ